MVSSGQDFGAVYGAELKALTGLAAEECKRESRGRSRIPSAAMMEPGCSHTFHRHSFCFFFAWSLHTVLLLLAVTAQRSTALQSTGSHYYEFQTGIHTHWNFQWVLPTAR